YSLSTEEISNESFSGHARAFYHHGDDIIDLTAATGTVVAYGGEGNDILIGSDYNDHLAGGSGDDILKGNAGSDHLYGDSGFNVELRVRYDLVADLEADHEMIVSTAVQVSDEDHAATRDNLVAGSDQIFGGDENDLIFGDHGYITHTAGSLKILGDAAVEYATTASEENGASDEITGDDGDDRIFAGSGTDYVNVSPDDTDTKVSGQTGDDVIVGDNGYANWDAQQNYTLSKIVSASPQYGSTDYIYANEGQKVIFGGAGSDVIEAGEDEQADIIVGDEGFALFDSETARLTLIATHYEEYGADDILIAGQAENVLVGGSGADQISGGKERDIVLGDNGYVQLTSTGLPAKLSSRLIDLQTLNEIEPDTYYGGDDTIDVLDGSDIVIAGVGGDYVNWDPESDTGTQGEDSERDIVLGDRGEAIFDTNGSTEQLSQIRTLNDATGDADRIWTDGGSDVILGGYGNDLLDAGSDNIRDVVLGDSGEIFFAEGDDELLSLVRSTTPEIGGDDDITVGDGDDVVIAGNGADYVNWDSSGTLLEPRIGEDTGKDVIIGDSGEAIFEIYNGLEALLEIRTIDDTQGGSDKIWTDGGTDVLLGGAGSDILDAGTDDSRDIVLGDNGEVFFVAGSGELLQRIGSTSPELGGDDDITVGDGDDVVIAGNGADYVNWDSSGTLLEPRIGEDTGKDVIIGDSGEAIFEIYNGLEALLEIRTIDDTQGGSDKIWTDGGTDVLLGGAGSDILDAGTDDSRDIVLGDNGEVFFVAGSGELLQRIGSTSPELGGDDDITVGDGDDVVIAG
ncbi:MAG: hypothetical protein ACPGLY_27865, partial [Rubripirellula sp.]